MVAECGALTLPPQTFTSPEKQVVAERGDALVLQWRIKYPENNKNLLKNYDFMKKHLQIFKEQV